MKKKFMLYAIVIAFITSASSCATIFCGSKKQVLIDANIEEASLVTIDGRKYTNVKFPFNVKVKRGFDETIVTSEAEGYNKTTTTIYKNFNAVSVLNLLSLLGWGIDAATGAMTKPEFKNYELEFEQSIK